jgi:hypothetical protein
VTNSRKVGSDPVPVVVGLDSAPAGGTKPSGKGAIVEETL